jgi:hypothetical protein
MDNNQQRLSITMQATTSYSKSQFLREVLELTKRRMMSRVANATASRANVNSSSSSVSLSTELTTNANLAEIILGVGYIFIIVAFLIKILLRTIRNFEYHYTSQSYNRFGFMMNEESDYDDDSDSIATSDHDENYDPESSSSSPILLRSTLSGKYLHLKTPLQTIDVVTPKTPLPPPLRRSLRLKIKSELNLCAMKNNNSIMITRSQTKQIQNIQISSDPCPINCNRDSITNPSPHPEHDEERAYYIRYCNEKKMNKQRREFNSPIFVRRLVL